MMATLAKKTAAHHPRLDKSIKAVMFDAVGTLMVPEPSVARAYFEAGKQFGSQLDEATLAARFRTAMALEDRKDGERFGGRTDQCREYGRWVRIVDRVFDDVSETEELFAVLWDHFASAANWRLRPDVAALWTALRKRKLIVGVASNFDDRLVAICSHLAPLDKETHIFASSQLGWRKPAVGFFREIESRLGLAPEQLLLVGDDMLHDYTAAREAGWHAMLLDPQGECAGVPHLRALSELTTIIEA